MISVMLFVDDNFRVNSENRSIEGDSIDSANDKYYHLVLIISYKYGHLVLIISYKYGHLVLIISYNLQVWPRSGQTETYLQLPLVECSLHCGVCWVSEAGWPDRGSWPWPTTFGGSLEWGGWPEDWGRQLRIARVINKWLVCIRNHLHSKAQLC